MARILHPPTQRQPLPAGIPARLHPIWMDFADCTHRVRVRAAQLDDNVLSLVALDMAALLGEFHDELEIIAVAAEDTATTEAWR